MDKKALGTWGETQALHHLSALGYVLVRRNWRAAYPRRGELDLVFWQNEVLVFVEVKTLRYKRFGLPEQQVSSKKEKTWWQTACALVAELDYEGPVRFDIVAIVQIPYELKHFEDVFFPMG